MKSLSDAYIRDTLADSPMIFDRGKQTCENGSYFLSERDRATRDFVYEFDGRFGQYTTRVEFLETKIRASCTCPYPGRGCRHVVAAALNARELLLKPRVQQELFPDTADPYLSGNDIRELALAERKERAATENFTPIRGDMFTGDHKVISKERRTYTVCLHDPANARGHCSCPDYLTNGLGTCKHIIFMAGYLKSEPGFKAQVATESLPFTDIFWDSNAQAPRLFPPGPKGRPGDLKPALDKYFDDSGNFTGQDISLVMGLMLRLHGDRRVRIRENLLKRVDHRLQALQQAKMEGRPRPQVSLPRPLYPFQKEGVDFGTLKTGVLIADEMGLGKSAQAVATALNKCETFGFSKVLVITLASLKPKWRQEIEAMSRKKARIIQGPPAQRRSGYLKNEQFKISHYEAVVRDAAAITEMNPDIIILDEAQRIKNFSTRTAETVKRLPKKHAVVLTGTPLENKPEDLYSIVQFLDPYKFTPLWQFSADHYRITREAKNKIAGYKNLAGLREKLRDILIRRTWDEVSDQLPPTVTSTYYIDLAPEQRQRHRACAARLGEILARRILTDMDMEQIRTQVLTMRMAANSTYLLDRETQISPKLRELAAIVDEVVVQNKRKMVIFSEWTAMTFLIARRLSEAGIGFVEASGKVGAPRRRELVRRFTRSHDCPVFLTTDAGSRGQDLSAARCMVNVELPWTPAQAAGRLARLTPAAGDEGEESRPCHIINLIGAGSIEEGIARGLADDPDLFTALFGTNDTKENDSETERRDLADRLDDILGPELLPRSVVPDDKEIPDDNPYFGFPETMAGQDQAPAAPSGLVADPEKLEHVLNAGLDFMAGLVEMATGEPGRPMADREIKIDPDTGRISLSFNIRKPSKE
ncbi:MAG: DEAD/DEAH box helicase [Desulfobacter sp.]|nr:MAG: DEAD/DEAH box helicase [Desulfobacter sp.]